MRMTRLGALIASAFFAAGTAHAGLLMDFDGGGAAPTVNVTSLDWAPTSVLAKDANTAAVGFGTTCGAGSASGAPCLFEILTHSKLGQIQLAGASGFSNLPAGFVGEVTMVTRMQMVMTLDAPGFISFETTGVGWTELYYSSTANSDTVSGSNFNDGTLIARLLGASEGVMGNFTVSSAVPQDLDQSGTNDFPGQKTLPGFGSMGNVTFGKDGIDLDPAFFKTSIAGFDMDFENISIGLPNRTADPSDCYNLSMQPGAVGTTGLSTQCTGTHVFGLNSAQGDDGGYAPRTGDINVADNENPDFVAQTDFNSAVSGVPEPASIALLGLALGGLGFASRRRKVS